MTTCYNNLLQDIRKQSRSAATCPKQPRSRCLLRCTPWPRQRVKKELTLVARVNAHWLQGRNTRSLSPHQWIPSLHTGPREATHSGTGPVLISHRPSPTRTPDKTINLRESFQLRSTCGLERTAGNSSWSTGTQHFQETIENFPLLQRL